jgi:hypothetical protein
MMEPGSTKLPSVPPRLANRNDGSRYSLVLGKACVEALSRINAAMMRISRGELHGDPWISVVCFTRAGSGA